MTKPAYAKRIDLGGDILAAETSSPNDAGGVVAQASSLWLRQGDGISTPTQIYLNMTGGATTWTIQNLVNLKVFNVKNFGAVGDGITDDTVPINAAVAQAVAGGVGGVIYFPPGIFRVTKPAGQVASINLSNVHNLVFMGDGFASQISMIGSAGFGDWYMFRLRNGTSRITFTNLGLTSAITNPDPAEQNHFFNISGVFGDANGGPHDIEVVGCYIRQIQGDGVRVLGEIGQVSDDIRVLYNDFDMVSSRSCTSAQRQTSNVSICYNFVTGSHDQQIDFEPTAGDGPLQWTVVGNHVEHSTSTSAAAITLSGSSNVAGVQANRRCTVAFNTITHGGAIASNKGLVGATIMGNICTIDQTAVSSSAAPIDLFQRVQDVAVVGNVAFNQVDTNHRIGIRIAGQATLTAPADHLIVTDNMVTALGSNCQGISVSDTTETVVIGNLVQVDTSVATVSTGVSWVAVEQDIDHIVCAGNMIIGLSNQMKIGFSFSCSGHNVSNCHAIHNFVHLAFTIISYSRVLAEQFLGWRGAVGNNGVAVSNVPLSASTQDGVTGDGNPGPAAQIVIVQTAPGPEGLVQAPVGSVCTNTLGGQAKIIWYKEAGSGVSGGNTGWASDGADELAMGAQDLTLATTAVFLAPGIGLAVAGTVEIKFRIPRPGTIRNLRVACVPGTGNVLNTYTLRKNGVATAVNLIMANTAATATGTGQVVVVAGDVISIQVTKNLVPLTAQTEVVASFDLSA